MLIVKQRRKARIAALQFLFSLEFHPLEGEEELKYFWKHNPNNKTARVYAEKIIKGVLNNKEQIDEIIKEALEKWSLDRVGYIERVIVRIATYEGGIEKCVSPKTAISEAIELARMFGSEDAPKFVNGVLDRLFQSQGWLKKKEVKE
ncbi:MAG TPA: transcription antitermination factor NusB [Candidatus Hydrogenedens sp.]|nr:transcription antitermination factor NusB [Candidatus Hydrogenedens sp.]HOK08360.1 transcription antitermination factor NusB [Candidatus Hydrogenedens sp.]HOL20599.1 transcription antitermination factor NusB [Candidatus Hydrogenedens sp.]HPP57654.1 transcription antitermination factor NusB [Candidatus Hydrogenedens sp.]